MQLQIVFQMMDSVSTDTFSECFEQIRLFRTWPTRLYLGIFWQNPLGSGADRQK
jgi:hypothetical protein